MFLLKIEINLKLANVGISKNHHWVCIELIDVYLKKNCSKHAAWKVKI